MLKSIGVLSVLAAALATGAMLPAEDEGCPAGKCGSQKDTALAEKPCGQCPLTATSLAGKTCAAGECSEGTCSKSSCEGCPLTIATSSDTASACAAGKCSEGEGSTVATSANGAGEAVCAGSACGTAACGAACGKDCKDCPITAAMNRLPQMTFAVGSEKTCCPNEASELAKKSDANIQFVVAEKNYDEEGQAKQALAEITEKFVAAFVEPKVCPESGDITVAGQKACCEGSAGQVSKVAKAAMEKVQMTYLVGEKQCHCPVEAEKLAKDSGDVTVFVVGEEKTACNVTARLNLARAKYRAAVVALMQSEPKTIETSSTGS